MKKTAYFAFALLGLLLIARPWANVGTVDIRGVAYMLAGSMSAEAGVS